MSEKTPDQIVSEYWGHFHGGTMSFETVVKEIVRAERKAAERKVEMLKKALEEAKELARHRLSFVPVTLWEDARCLCGKWQANHNAGWSNEEIERKHRIHVLQAMDEFKSLAASTLEEVGK